MFVNTDNGRKEEVDEMKFEVRRNFESNFVENSYEREVLEGVELLQLYFKDKKFLYALFMKYEIKEAVVNCRGDKKLIPDGFSFSILQS